MILSIVAYGAPVLRVVSKDITPDYPGLPKLIEDMWETMYASNGVGLAAPQINRDIRLFVVDSSQILPTRMKMSRVNILMSQASSRCLSMRISNRLMVRNGLIMKDA